MKKFKLLIVLAIIFTFTACNETEDSIVFDPNAEAVQLEESNSDIVPIGIHAYVELVSSEITLLVDGREVKGQIDLYFSDAELNTLVGVKFSDNIYDEVGFTQELLDEWVGSNANKELNCKEQCDGHNRYNWCMIKCRTGQVVIWLGIVAKTANEVKELFE